MTSAAEEEEKGGGGGQTGEPDRSEDNARTQQDGEGGDRG